MGRANGTRVIPSGISIVQGEFDEGRAQVAAFCVLWARDD